MQYDRKLSSALSVRAWSIWILATLFYFYENIIQVSPGVMVPDLMHTFNISSAALGSVIAFFFYAYAAMQIPVGVLVDHYDARYLLTFAVLSCVLGCLLFGLADTLAMIAMGRFFIGLGAAFAAVCAMKLAGNWFPSGKFSYLVGLMVTIGMLGSMVGERPLAVLVERHGWRPSIHFLAYCGVFLAMLIFCIVRHSPDHLHQQHSAGAHRHRHRSLFSGLRKVVQTKQSWVLAIYGGLMFASTSIFGGLWGVPFIMQTHTLTRPTAAGVVSMLFFGWVIGAPMSGMLVNLLRSHKAVLALGSLGTLVIITAIIYITGLSTLSLAILIFSFGFFSSCFLPSFTLMHDLHAGGQNSGAALGFMNTANMLGGAIGQPLIGMLLDLTWNGAFVEGAPAYTTANYQTALLVLPALIAISLLLLPMIEE